MDAPFRPPGDATVTLLDARQAAAGPQRSYLLVIEGLASRVFPLPSRGEIVIGRGGDAQLQLADPLTSRRHASLCCEAGAVRVSDLGSQNGTLVNGERLTASRLLASRDVIAICDVTLILHRDAGLPQTRSLQGEAALRERLEQEVARAQECQCALAILCIDPGPGPRPDLPRLGAALAETGRLRRMDFLAAAGDRLLLLLPEQSDEDVVETASALLAALGPLAPSARAGWASWPEDGGDADTLLSGLRCATEAARPGQLLRASELSIERTVGEHRVLLADLAMLRTYDLLDRLARSDLPVLVTGETGTGKELAAAALHHGSPRRTQRLLALNCAAFPESLLEGELFGYERGAFSGAVAAKAGLLESAHGGTVFLDEVGELPLPAQAKLLRVLETGQVLRIGDLRERTVDIRVVSATHRNLQDEVLAGRFRQDLLFRLAAATVALPPLRDRTRELSLLARRFLLAACARLGRPPLSLSGLVLQRLLSHPWPGNVRELKNVMEYLASTCPDPVVAPWHLPPLSGHPLASKAPEPTSAPTDRPRFRPLMEELRDLERVRMEEALQAAGGVKTRAAELLSVPVRTFTGKIKLYGLSELAGPRTKDD